MPDSGAKETPRGIKLQQPKSHGIKFTGPPRLFNTLLWFNTPCSANGTTNIGNMFLQILDKHFPKTYRFHKLFKSNNAKVSYSSLSNFASIINSHNKKIQ